RSIETATRVPLGGEWNGKAGAPMRATNNGNESTQPESALLSITQQRLWFLEQLTPGSAQYVVCAAYELRGPLDVAALDAALTALTARHDALRMNVMSHAG